MPPKVAAPAPARILDAGTKVAFSTPESSWILGAVQSYDPKTRTYVCISTDPPVKGEKQAHDSLWVPRAENLDEDVNDLLLLTELHEAALLLCLKRRYLRDVVYTNIGPIVVAVNPFNYNIPWYKDDFMPRYLEEGVVIERNLPHTWAVAHNTYWEMRENAANQTILISGESGAGKTEAAKIVVKYVGTLSTMHGTVAQKDAMSAINRRIIAASPILEAFGNAKTVRNDNSSRFGKFVQLQFDRDGFLVGSYAIKYLLEKSRIIGAAKDERVYHSFYQLAAGEDHKLYGIRQARVHRMLVSGETLTVDTIDDVADYAACKQAMVDVGVSAAEQSAIWRLVAGILYFQNVGFVEQQAASGLTASVDKDLELALQRACEHWCVAAKDVERELVTMSRVAKNETVVQMLDKARAQDTRDSTSKGIYDALFDWLVAKINATTDVSVSGSSAKTAQWIGLLDIFGFEDFQSNSFEQICINLANETLQNHYNYFIFTEDVRECREEGLDTEFVTFCDNKGCIDLLSGGKISIFSLLDEECKISGTDKQFIAKVQDHFQTTKEKVGSAYFLPVAGRAAQFKIRHYAGDVCYTVDGWLEKNRDTFKDDMRRLFHASTDPFVARLLPPIDDGARGGKPTVNATFARQLTELMAMINSTNPHWIRCIKPHPARQPRMFSHVSVMTQLRSAGVLDTIKVRQGGYPIRFTQELFTQRYRVLCGLAGSVPERCRRVLEMLKLGKEVAQIGKTKVFLRPAAFTALNIAKDEATVHYARLWQRVCRAHQERSSLFVMYVRQHRERLVAARRAKEELLRREREEMARREREALEEHARRQAAQEQREQEAAQNVKRRLWAFLMRLKVLRAVRERRRAREERACTDALRPWRTPFDCDDRIARIEARAKERESRTAAEREEAQRRVVGSTIQQTLQLSKERRAQIAQRNEATLAAIHRRNEESTAIFEKRLRTLCDRTRQSDADKREAAENRARVERSAGAAAALDAELASKAATARLRADRAAAILSPPRAIAPLASVSPAWRTPEAGRSHNTADGSVSPATARAPPSPSVSASPAAPSQFGNVRDLWAAQQRWGAAQRGAEAESGPSFMEREMKQALHKERLFAGGRRPLAPSPATSAAPHVLAAASFRNVVDVGAILGLRSTPSAVGSATPARHIDFGTSL